MWQLWPGRGGNEIDADRNKTDEPGRQEVDDEAVVEDALLAEIDAVAERARRLADGSATALDRAGALGQDLFLRDPDRDEAAVLSEWLNVAGECEAQPPVLTAAFILDVWLILDPVERRTELGRLLAAAAMRRTVTPNHLPLVAVGLRQSKFRWRRAEGPSVRVDSAGKVTAAAVDRMLEQLGSALPQELTGRGRYRAWGVL